MLPSLVFEVTVFLFGTNILWCDVNIPSHIELSNYSLT